jgi:hypothetical protein
MGTHNWFERVLLPILVLTFAVATCRHQINVLKIKLTQHTLVYIPENSYITENRYPMYIFGIIVLCLGLFSNISLKKTHLLTKVYI